MPSLIFWRDHILEESSFTNVLDDGCAHLDVFEVGRFQILDGLVIQKPRFLARPVWIRLCLREILMKLQIPISFDEYALRGLLPMSDRRSRNVWPMSRMNLAHGQSFLIHIHILFAVSMWITILLGVLLHR